MTNFPIILRSEDWVTVYINGKKVAEGHSILAEDYIKLGMEMYKYAYLISQVKDIDLKDNDIAEEIIESLPEYTKDLDNSIKDLIV